MALYANTAKLVLHSKGRAACGRRTPACCSWNGFAGIEIKTNRSPFYSDDNRRRQLEIPIPIQIRAAPNSNKNKGAEFDKDFITFGNK